MLTLGTDRTNLTLCTLKTHCAMKKLYIETYGCQMNVADSEVIASVMKMADYESQDSIEGADAVLLNTCSVRDNAEQKIYHRLEELNHLRLKNSKVQKLKIMRNNTCSVFCSVLCFEHFVQNGYKPL